MFISFFLTNSSRFFDVYCFTYSTCEPFKTDFKLQGFLYGDLRLFHKTLTCIDFIF